ncbi:hypothetical protein WKW50_25485, partial [Ochrobactrum sp. GPK 3]
VSRSNLIERLKGKSKPRGPYNKVEDAELLPTIRMTCKRWLRWLSKFRPKLGFSFLSKGVRKATSSETSSKINQKGQPIHYPKAGPTGGLKPFASRKLAFE